MRTLIASTAFVAAVLLAGPAGAQTGAASGTGQFCLKTMAGQANCNYQTMAQCEKSKPTGSSDQCVDRSQITGTTGSGGGMPQPGGSGSAPSTNPAMPPR